MPQVFDDHSTGDHSISSLAIIPHRTFDYRSTSYIWQSSHIFHLSIISLLDDPIHITSIHQLTPIAFQAQTQLSLDSGNEGLISSVSASLNLSKSGEMPHSEDRAGTGPKLTRSRMPVIPTMIIRRGIHPRSLFRSSIPGKGLRMSILVRDLDSEAKRFRLLRPRRAGRKSCLESCSRRRIRRLLRLLLQGRLRLCSVLLRLVEARLAVIDRRRCIPTSVHLHLLRRLLRLLFHQMRRTRTCRLLF